MKTSKNLGFCAQKLTPYFAGIAALLFATMPLHAATTTVDQQGQKFASTAVTLKKGDTIRYENHDDVNHNIETIDEDGNVADQGIQKPGDAITVPFTKEGTFEVRCKIHPRMKMSVTVN